MKKNIAIVSFSGYTEKIDENTGTMKLYQSVLRRYTSANINVFVPREWNDKPRAFARMLKNLGYDEVILIGYSWGGGWGSRVFADECEEIGLSIPIYLLCDPVFRPMWMPGGWGANPLSLRSITKWAKIKIPSSAEQVFWVRQEINKPSGHKLKPKNKKKTYIHDEIILPYKHTKIDNSQEWYDLVDITISAHLAA